MLNKVVFIREGSGANGNASLPRWSGRSVFAYIGILLMLLAGCSGSQSTTPTTPATLPSPTRPASTVSPVDNGPPTTTSGTAQPGPTAPAATTPAESTPITPQTPTATPEPISLKVISPADGSALEVGFARVMGATTGTSVSINGLPAEPDQEGDFQRDVTLQEGVNFIEVVASDELGRTASQQITVFVVAPNANLPFTILYPRDGLEVADPTVPVVGVTVPDAVVGVNDVPVEINASGIFSTRVELEEGANLIEVVAADIEGNVRFQTVAVFHIP